MNVVGPGKGVPRWTTSAAAGLAGPAGWLEDRHSAGRTALDVEVLVDLRDAVSAEVARNGVFGVARPSRVVPACGEESHPVLSGRR